MQLIDEAALKTSTNQGDDYTSCSTEQSSCNLDSTSVVSNVIAVDSCTNDGAHAIDLGTMVGLPTSEETVIDSMQEINTNKINDALLQNSHCSCPCRLMAAEIEGIKLDMVILQKQFESRADFEFVNESCVETSLETSNLEKELSEAKTCCKQLQNDISLIVRERNAEVGELTHTIRSLETRTAKAEEERDSLRLALTLIMQQSNDNSDKFMTHDETKADKTKILKKPMSKQNTLYQQEYETNDKFMKRKGKNSDCKRDQQNKHQQNIQHKTNGRDMPVAGHNRFDVLVHAITPRPPYCVTYYIYTYTEFIAFISVSALPLLPATFIIVLLSPWTKRCKR